MRSRKDFIKELGYVIEVDGKIIGNVMYTKGKLTDENGEDKIVIRTTPPMNICFDHRALGFGEVRPFLTKMDEFFKNPEMILNENA